MIEEQLRFGQLTSTCQEDPSHPSMAPKHPLAEVGVSGRESSAPVHGVHGRNKPANAVLHKGSQWLPCLLPDLASFLLCPSPVHGYSSTPLSGSLGGMLGICLPHQAADILEAIKDSSSLPRNPNIFKFLEVETKQNNIVSSVVV